MVLLDKKHVVLVEWLSVYVVFRVYWKTLNIWKNIHQMRGC